MICYFLVLESDYIKTEEILYEIMLETRNLTKKIKTNGYLKNISIKVEKGKIYGTIRTEWCWEINAIKSNY